MNMFRFDKLEICVCVTGQLLVSDCPLVWDDEREAGSKLYEVKMQNSLKIISHVRFRLHVMNLVMVSHVMFVAFTF
jgi:hypothetical protein